MKKLLFVLSVIVTVFTLNVAPVAFADEALPEIAPVDEAAPPALDETVPAESTPDTAPEAGQ